MTKHHAHGPDVFLDDLAAAVEGVDWLADVEAWMPLARNPRTREQTKQTGDRGNGERQGEMGEKGAKGG